MKSALMVVLLVVGVLAFVFLVPLVHLPYADHFVCTASGASCRAVAQYGSLSYFYLCTGAVYETDASYWVGTCMSG